MRVFVASARAGMGISVIGVSGIGGRSKSGSRSDSTKSRTCSCAWSSQAFQIDKGTRYYYYLLQFTVSIRDFVTKPWM